MTTIMAHTVIGPEITISEDEWQALRYVRYQTPLEAVVVSNSTTSFNFSGLAGRADYMGDPYFSLEGIALTLNPRDDRRQRLAELWATSDERFFCARLLPTPATHFVEYAKQPHPQFAHTPSCLQPIWVSPQQEVSIFQINHSSDITQTPPLLVKQGYDGFNIFLYQDQYYALSQSLAEVELSGLDETELAQYQQQGSLLTAFYLKDIEQLIKAKTELLQTITTSSTHPSLADPVLLFDTIAEPDHAWHTQSQPPYPQWIDLVFHRPITLQAIALQAQLGGPTNRDRAPQHVVIFGGTPETHQELTTLQFNFAQPGDWSFQPLPPAKQKFQTYRLLIVDNHGQPDFTTIQELRFLALVEDNYQGFNIFWYDNNYYALVQSLEAAPLFQMIQQWTQPQIAAFCHQNNKCISAASLEQIKTQLNQLAAPSSATRK